MPIYEYQCNECGRIEEVLEMHENEDHTNLPCPQHCPGHMKRIMSAHSFIERVNLRIPKIGSGQRKKV